MVYEPIFVKMFGTFSISAGSQTVDDSMNRSRKLWLLIAYLIYNRSRFVPQEELMELLWGKEKSRDNSVGALKTTLYRARAVLDPLVPEGESELILHKNGGYGWNPNVPIELDTDRFELLCEEGESAADPIKRLEDLKQALAFYTGEFLTKLSTEFWVIPLSAYYHNLYLKAASEVLMLLLGDDRLEEAETLCRAVLDLEPYQESFYQELMRILQKRGNYKGITQVYETMRDILFTNFGVLPDETSQAVYREAMRTINDRALPPNIILEQLRENDEIKGAMICDYDFFRVLYQSEARSLDRRGDAVHIGLLTVTGKNGEELSKRSLDRAMELLERQIRDSLRKGDTASRCSVSQFVLMLPQANYENSCMVCERVIRAFFRRNPTSPAEIRFVVYPIEPAQ